MLYAVAVSRAKNMETSKISTMVRKVRDTNGTKNPRMERKSMVQIVHGTKSPPMVRNVYGTKSLVPRTGGSKNRNPPNPVSFIDL